MKIINEANLTVKFYKDILPGEVFLWECKYYFKTDGSDDSNRSNQEIFAVHLTDGHLTSFCRDSKFIVVEAELHVKG